jgi:hypothetical protein
MKRPSHSHIPRTLPQNSLSRRGIPSLCLLHSPKAYRVAPSRGSPTAGSPGQLTVQSGKQEPGRSCLTMCVYDIVRSTHPLKSGVPARKSGRKYRLRVIVQCVHLNAPADWGLCRSRSKRDSEVFASDTRCGKTSAIARNCTRVKPVHLTDRAAGREDTGL